MNIKDFFQKLKRAKAMGSKALEKKAFQMFFGQHVTCLEDLETDYNALTDDERERIDYLSEKLGWHKYITAAVYVRGKYAEMKFKNNPTFMKKVDKITKILKRRVEDE